MKALIVEYRGHEIHFDTEENSFIAISDKYDRQFERKSFAAAKKEIDDFIKDNVSFKPVFVQKSNGLKVKLIGIRKDGRFVYDENGRKEQFSTYDESDHFIYSEVNDNIFELIDKKYSEIQSLNSEIKKLKDGLIKEDLGLKELKKSYAPLIN